MANPVFRFFLSIFVFLYRLTGGRFGGHMQGLAVLLLSTTGRRSGRQRTTPLGCFEQDGNYVIIGSNAGADTHPGWSFNLIAHPEAEIQIGDKHLNVRAELAGPDKRPQLWARLLELSPGYGNYTTKTKREIRVFILHRMKS